ncbi:Piwi-like protein 1 [Acipenser ruthenus]|uniref:Piwi-like protein 1 n=1 Tax=Acipenser ruthenus TaxID=7906 RepID=A0A662YRG2_ACIRT|nr:Piwi-like protein 1 [Acipenser ruthenus]
MHEQAKGTLLDLMICWQYNLDICDNNQVLLVSELKRQGPAGGAPRGPALLVPEFCYLTGISSAKQGFVLALFISE